MSETKELVPCVKWTNDCQGKKDYDGPLVLISCRYWPRGGGFHILDVGGFRESTDPSIKPSASAAIHLEHGEQDDNGFGDYEELARAEFDGETQEEVQRQVEQWVKGKFGEISSLLFAHFGVAPKGVERKP